MTSSVDLNDIDSQDFSEEIPASEGSVIWHLLKQLRPGMDLSRVTLPTFILETRSTIQRLTDWMAHADILDKIPGEDDPILRMLHLCTWLVAGFHLSPRTPKKPFNSVRGEMFRAVLTNDDGNIQGAYVGEQVSHHPPISAFHYVDRNGNSVMWGHVEMRSRFYGNSMAALMNHEGTQINYECLSRHETYKFTMPDMFGRGILIGRLAMEICGKIVLSCEQTGVTATIDFKEKPSIGGRYNIIKGQIFGPADPSIKKPKPLLTFSGRWSAFVLVKDLRSGSNWLAFDVREAKPMRVVTPPPEDMCPYESIYLWKMVKKYIEQGDLMRATEHKLAIEEKQRAETKYFEENSMQWENQMFRFDEEQKRYVPIELNLTPYDPSEPPMTMPHPFHIPNCILRAEEAGISKTVDQMHEAAEQKVSRTH